jgi:hypothetical protein
MDGQLTYQIMISRTIKESVQDGRYLEFDAIASKVTNRKFLTKQK